MTRKSKLAATAIAGGAAVGAGVGTAAAAGGDDDATERPISGDAYDKAADAALDACRLARVVLRPSPQLFARRERP